MNHEFFAEGVKLEVIPPQVDAADSTKYVMRMEVPNKDVRKHGQQESIEFQYDIATDIPDQVVGEMVSLPPSLPYFLSLCYSLLPFLPS